MPAGMSWSRYLKLAAASMISMFAGAQVVHVYYRPLDDLPELVEREFRARLNEAKE